MKKLFIIAAALGILGVAACKKSSTSSNTSGGNIDISGKTKQEVFMMQKWKIGSWTDSNSNLGLQDLLDACEKDDSYTFSTTTSYLLDRGACKNSSDKQTETFPWSMPSSNSTSVTFFTYNFTIVNQTSTTITLTRQYNSLGYDTKQTVVLGKY